ncbi:ATP-binding cassette domain-containing protein [Ralstonia syzygii]|uniref:Putative ABC transporter ATP-binding and permease component n=1 Tax=Ralstonia syzygii R24 TaxID=907261 RepID=G3A5S6_9RALS|nr:ATP-binding cassette domain-containing protein [Ralstonia syzygii]CCA89137.1 putative ABC transporter ATP-binding and permease component [Ralstonia syzygii R24]
MLTATAIQRRDVQTGTPLLHPASLAVHPGDRIALTGPSGAGKSVLLRALALLDPLDDGHVTWRGETVSAAGVPAFRCEVAYVRQRPALLPGSVEDNLQLPYRLHTRKTGPGFDRDAAIALLARADRDARFLDKSATDLSGGEAQIAALVRTLQTGPATLLLDEPTAALDPASARAIEAMLLHWFAQAPERRAWVWITHNPAQATRIASRYWRVEAGHLDTQAPVPRQPET